MRFLFLFVPRLDRGGGQEDSREGVRRLLTNTRHEIRVQCVRDWYAKKGVKKLKKKCRIFFLKKDEYLEVHSLLTFLAC